MNQLQTLLTRVFRLEKPIDKRLIWVGLGALALFAFILFSGLSDGSSTTKVKANSSVITKSSDAGKKIRAPMIFVHVVGQVVRPGIYELSTSSRVVDAIFAASGFSRKADQASINLARVLTDGEQINVARIGASDLNSTEVSATQPMSLNRASQSQLEGLPSIGPTLAARIVDWRTANGGFKSKNDLLKVSGIGDNLFGKIKDLVSL